MKYRRTLRISVAVAASLGVHFAAAMVAAQSPPQVFVEGGATAEIATLGSSFEDLLQGSDRLAPAESAPAKPVQAERARQIEVSEPENAAPARPVEIAHAAQAVVEPTAFRAESIPVMPEILTGTVPVVVQPAKNSETARLTEIVLPPMVSNEIEAAKAVGPFATVQPAPSAESARAAEIVAQDEIEPAKPVEMAALTPSHAAEIIRAEPEAPPIPVPLARPPQPDDERNLAKANEARNDKKTERTQVANVARGNAGRNARAGSTQGRAESKAKTGGGNRDGKADRAGNAKASNYPGKVYSKIRRTRQKNAGGAGVARVRFSIAANGALANVRIVASSGLSSVDNAAVDHVRRSAPFPPPPAGAQRQFVIPVEVRR